jgi:hypothetical protein
MSWFTKAPPVTEATSFPKTPSDTMIALPSVTHDERVVRFHDECILIPESRLKRPRLLSKSYSLPLWKKKPPSSTSDSDPDESSNVVFKVPVPRSVYIA